MASNPVYDANGEQEQYNGQALSQLPTTTITPSAAVLAAAKASQPSTLDRINDGLHDFNGAVTNDLVNQGAQALHDGDQAGFVWNGIKYSFYKTFAPDSVQQAAIGVAGGAAFGKGLGIVAKEATTLFPVLGRDVGDLASDFGNQIIGKSTTTPFVSNPSAIGATNEAGIFDYLWDKTNLADFSTPANKAAFYTGYDVNYPRASAWAIDNNGFVIDKTSGGQWLEGQTYGSQAQLSRQQVDLLWEEASVRYAAGASGDVHIFNSGVANDPTKVLYRVELPVLRRNPNVNLIWH